MQLTGYADKFSVKPGETIKFYVSSKQPKYKAELVRVIHGDPNPKGPGFKTESVPTAAITDPSFDIEISPTLF